MSKFLIVAKAAAADGNMRWNARWRFSAEAEMGTIFPKYTRVYNVYTHVRPRLYTHTHRCAEGTDDDGAVWGGPMAPINGLITGHPGWHALLGRNPDERIWEIRKYAKGNWNRVRSMEMNHLLVVVRDGKNSNTGAVDSVTLCLFV